MAAPRRLDLLNIDLPLVTEGREPKTLVLILAREFASKLATPVFVADSEG